MIHNANNPCYRQPRRGAGMRNANNPCYRQPRRGAGMECKGNMLLESELFYEQLCQIPKTAFVIKRSRHTPPRTRGKPAACWCCVLPLLPAVVDPLIHMRCPMSRCDFTV